MQLRWLGILFWLSLASLTACNDPPALLNVRFTGKPKQTISFDASCDSTSSHVFTRAVVVRAQAGRQDLTGEAWKTIDGIAEIAELKGFSSASSFRGKITLPAGLQLGPGESLYLVMLSESNIGQGSNDEVVEIAQELNWP